LKQKRFPESPEENILYFIEKNSPKLRGWQREIVRIVRKTAQYFYPQGQTKVINEGCATHTHYEIINRMYEEGYLADDFMLEFYHHHSNVIFQPSFDSQYYSGLNPYTLGFNIFQDLKRMSLNPTKEDIEWFPKLAGKGDWIEQFRYIVENFKDETFVLQYLSPKVIRDMKLFRIDDGQGKTHYEISAIHNEDGYKRVRQSLSEQYNRSRYVPDIQVLDVDVFGDRTMTLEYTPTDGKGLDYSQVIKVVPHVELLWGFPVKITESGKEIYTSKK
jgi:spore cortex formation protein SpoVR/YcgB (stage V sporulation)